MPTRTTLSTILDNMNRWQAVEDVEEQYKVRDLDFAIKKIRRETVFPWALKQSTLRVFRNVFFYPVESDHDELAFFDNNSKTWANKPRTRTTSIKEFLENPMVGRNDLSEIWDEGDRMIGLRYLGPNTTEKLLNNAETASDFSVADDATAVEKDSVVFKEGSASMRITIVNSAGVATITNTFTSFSDSLYKRKYHFRLIYLDAVPTSIELRLRSSAGNYLSTVVTTQFSGQAFKADAWNLVAHDLNIASETGTFNSSTISSEQIILNGAATGTYFVDTSYIRGWELLDYWFYGQNSIATVGETKANQEFFFNSSGVYSTDSQFVGDDEWVDWVMFEALTITLSDEENERVLDDIERNRSAARQAFFDNYPNLKPKIITSKYNFVTDHMNSYYGPIVREISNR